MIKFCEKTCDLCAKETSSPTHTPCKDSEGTFLVDGKEKTCPHDLRQKQVKKLCNKFEPYKINCPKLCKICSDVSPTAQPSVSPTAKPTTAKPTASPSASPSVAPTARPTASPTATPTAAPTDSKCDLKAKLYIETPDEETYHGER